jgi:hypothetical protein
MGTDPSVRSLKETEHRQSGGLIARELLALVGIGSSVDALRKRWTGAGARPEDGSPQPDLVVCASGNLAHLYFTIDERRLTMEQIEQHYPGLLSRVIDHPAVGCVLVRSSAGGALAISRTGRRRLDGEHVEGQDPLAPFGPLAARSLQRLDGFSNVGDLVLLSTVDQATGEVISFEDLVGCHGGLGGAQSEPFILHPAGWSSVREPLVGAPSVNRQLRTWLAEPTGRSRTLGPDGT